MSPKYFNTPFAANGEKTGIAELTQTDGTVSYQEGYGPDYAKNQEEVGAKFIEREQMNDLFHEITANLKLWQEQGLYPYNPDIAYAIGGRCIYDDGSGSKAYISTINNNTTVPSIGGTMQNGWMLNDVKAAMDQFGMFGNSLSLNETNSASIKLDDITFNSFVDYYRPTTGNTESLPISAEYAYQIITGTSGTSNNATQLAFMRTAKYKGIFIRIRASNAWGSWQSLGNKGINTAVALTTLSWGSSYVAPVNGVLWAQAAATSDLYIMLRVNSLTVTRSVATLPGSVLQVSYPIRAGQTCWVQGTATGDSSYPRVVRFYPD